MKRFTKYFHIVVMTFYFFQLYYILNLICLLVAIGTATESLNEWADEDAGIEAVQKILDTLDDVAALQDTEIDPDVLISMLRDNKLHTMLQVNLTYIDT